MQGGKKFAGVTIQDYKINSGLTAATLGQKPAPQTPPFPQASPRPPAQATPPAPAK
jgi:hypothetical protein